MGWITRDSHIAGREDVKLGPLRSDVTIGLFAKCVQESSPAKSP
jgi:hypothetical protein